MIRKPMMSGFCSNPSFTDGVSSHTRCRGWNRANPDREFQPCPCPCHYGETYECAGCGRDIREALVWPLDPDDGGLRYVHIDAKTGRAVGEECP